MRMATQHRLDATGAVLVASNGLDHFLQQVGMLEPVVDGRVQHRPARQAQNFLKGCIDEMTLALQVDDRHHGGEEIEGGEGLARDVYMEGWIRMGLLLPSHGRLLGVHGKVRLASQSLPISRRSAATSASLRAKAAFISSTRSWYFW